MVVCAAQENGCCVLGGVKQRRSKTKARAPSLAALCIAELNISNYHLVRDVAALDLDAAYEIDKGDDVALLLRPVRHGESGRNNAPSILNVGLAHAGQVDRVGRPRILRRAARRSGGGGGCGYGQRVGACVCDFVRRAPRVVEGPRQGGSGEDKSGQRRVHVFLTAGFQAFVAASYTSHEKLALGELRS